MSHNMDIRQNLAGAQWKPSHRRSRSVTRAEPRQHYNKVTIPSNLFGFVFCVITKDGGIADDSTTVAGPAILNFALIRGGRRFDWH
jgi:hypothetical protein